MKDFTPEQLKERFDQLSPEMRGAISSPQILNKIRGIGEKNGLMINQIGDLVEQVCLVMLGLAKASDFVKDTSSRLGIDGEKARSIAANINKDVFESLKQVMRRSEEDAEIAEAKSSSMTSIGSAGGFEIERDIPGNGERGVEKANAEAAAMTETDRINMLSDIENPKPTPQRIVSEPMIDQLLHAPAAIPEEKVVINDRPKQARTEPPANLPTNDPYRESIK